MKLPFWTLLLAATILHAASVTTLIGTGAAGFSDTHVTNPYGLAIGAAGARRIKRGGNGRCMFRRRWRPRIERTATPAAQRDPRSTRHAADLQYRQSPHPASASGYGRYLDKHGRCRQDLHSFRTGRSTD